MKLEDNVYVAYENVTPKFGYDFFLKCAIENMANPSS